MKFTPLAIEGLVLIELDIYTDNRGIFFESFNQKQFKDYGINVSFVQDNQSVSKKNVIRGLHFQNEPHSQGKLVSVIKGKVRDVAVDIRPGSTTFGQHVVVELSESNKRMLWIPIGFAHGFSVLEDNTIFFYKCTNFYNRKSERGIRYDDHVLNIDWGITQPVVSEKDLLLPGFNEYQSEIDN